MKRKSRYFLAAMLLCLPLVSGCSAENFEVETIPQYDITSTSQQEMAQICRVFADFQLFQLQTGWIQG